MGKTIVPANCGGCSSCFFRIFLVGLLLFFALAGVLFYKADDARNWARSQIITKFDGASIDWKSIQKQSCDGTINLAVYNGLPIGVIIEDLSYAIRINDHVVGSGFSISPKTSLVPYATSTLKLTFSVERVLMARALKATPSQEILQIADSFFKNLQNKKRKVKINLGGLIRIIGKIKFGYFVESFESPLDQTVAFEKK